GRVVGILCVLADPLEDGFVKFSRIFWQGTAGDFHDPVFFVQDNARRVFSALQIEYVHDIIVLVQVYSSGMLIFRQKKQYASDISGKSKESFFPDFRAMSTNPRPAPPFSDSVVPWMVSLYNC